jgi:hypothetical protein
MTMVDVERVHEWRGEDVLDADGQKVGRLHEVFYDPATGEPVLGSVRAGIFGRRSYLVPLADASAGRGYLRVAHSSALIKRAEGGRGADTLDARATREVSEVYGTAPISGELESRTLIERRRAEAEDARRHADELENAALERADEVKEAQARADRAARDADAAEREGESVRQAALEARQQADSVEAAERARRVPPTDPED